VNEALILVAYLVAGSLVFSAAVMIAVLGALARNLWIDRRRPVLDELTAKRNSRPLGNCEVIYLADHRRDGAA
jgi:hypothetical protein